MRRSRPVRADSDLLVEGTGQDYGWVSDFAGTAGTLADYGPGEGRPSWWQGSDRFDGSPVGPNGPDAGYGWDDRGRWRQASWWNQRPSGGVLPAVTRCTTVIVNPIIRTPWEVYRVSADGSTSVFEQLPLWMRDPTLRWTVPGPIQSALPIARRRSAHEFWQTILTHAIWWGQGAFVAQEAFDGQPLPGTMLILNPFALSQTEDGRWRIGLGDETFDTDFDGRFVLGGVRWRVCVMRGLPPNDDNDGAGQGVLSRHFDTLRLGAKIGTYMAGAFGNGVPAGYLKVSQPNFDEVKAAALKRAWMDAHGGDAKSIAVLNAMVDFTALSAKPVDNEATKLKFATLVDVAHGFGLSASWLDTSAGASLTYANISEKRRELLDISLAGWGQQFMEMLNAVMPYGTEVRIMWSRFTSPDLEQQATTLTQAIQAGWLTANEARERVGLPPMPGGDTADPGAAAVPDRGADIGFIALRAVESGHDPFDAVANWYGEDIAAMTLPTFPALEATT